MTPCWQNDTTTLYQGDSAQVLAHLPKRSVHCCVTSPPYWSLRDYDHPDQLGLEATPEEYVAKMVEVFKGVWRVLRDDGTLWLNLGDSYATRHRRDTGETPGLKPKNLYGIPWRVAFALQADGWYLRQDIIWHKPNPVTESVLDRCTKAHEYIFLFTKSARYWYDNEAVKEAAVSGTRNRRSVWTVAVGRYKGAHFATFPPKLIEPCILAGCPEQRCPVCGAGWKRIKETTRIKDPHRHTGRAKVGCTSRWASTTPRMIATTRTLGTTPACKCQADSVPGVVLDPFAGAGTVALVASQYRRHAILCELNPEYCDQIQQRLDKPQTT